MTQPVQQQFSPHGVIDDLASILRPLAADAFLARDYGRRFVHVPGSPGKFSALLPWPVLNDIIEQHRLEPPRLRLTREGKPVPAERYTTFQTNSRKSGHPIPRLNAVALTRELRDGATLVLDNVDELHPPVRRLAESLERLFRVRIQVNSYSGWRTSHGFDLHWDDHDVFILQVAGRKDWKVYGMTRPYPLPRDVKSAEPPSQVQWEGVLNAGDLLYIPRGWWHVATPLDEPTLHLTVGVNNPTGADFLSWFAERLRQFEIVRHDIPHLQGPDAMREYAGQIRDAMLAAWNPEVINDYMDDLDAKSSPRPHFALPWSATAEILPPGRWRVRWSGSRPSSIEANGAGEISVIAVGRRWKFAQAARPLLEVLISGRTCAQADFEIAANRSLDPITIRQFVRELVVNGLVVLR